MGDPYGEGFLLISKKTFLAQNFKTVGLKFYFLCVLKHNLLLSYLDCLQIKKTGNCSLHSGCFEEDLRKTVTEPGYLTLFEEV